MSRTKLIFAFFEKLQSVCKNPLSVYTMFSKTTAIDVEIYSAEILGLAGGKFDAFLLFQILMWLFWWICFGNVDHKKLANSDYLHTKFQAVFTLMDFFTVFRLF
jgi:hypothetical protein